MNPSPLLSLRPYLIPRDLCRFSFGVDHTPIQSYAGVTVAHQIDHVKAKRAEEIKRECEKSKRGSPHLSPSKLYEGF